MTGSTMIDFVGVPDELQEPINRILDAARNEDMSTFLATLDSIRREILQGMGDPSLTCHHPDGCTCVLFHGLGAPDPHCAWTIDTSRKPS